MKVNELMEGKWVAKSKDGKERRFKNLADAEHWRNNYSRDITPAKPKSSAEAYHDYMKWAEQEEERLKKQRDALKPKSAEIWRRFETAVGDSFPDGDPFDRISSWLNKHDLTIHDVDAAVKEFSDASTAHEYLAKMWDDYSADAEHDALQGAHGDTYDDQWFQRANPWK